MGAARAHIVFPKELMAEIDAEVGPRGRSAFLAELAKKEINRRKLLAFLERGEVIWKDEDHPELAEGSYKWVRSLRDDWDKRVDEKFAQSDDE
jgi:hypothetical protein